MRPLVFVLPGGGYSMHADHEAEPVAEWLRSIGCDAEVLRYPLAPARYPAALQFVRRRIIKARQRSAAPIGVLGFSAGGHLAGQVALEPATHPEALPDFAVLCYPVVSLGEDGHAGTRLNLIGPGAPNGMAEQLSLHNLVTSDSPPIFIWHTSDDGEVPVHHSLKLSNALAGEAVPHELHVFAHGEHGIGLACQHETASIWPTLCALWIQARTQAHRS